MVAGLIVALAQQISADAAASTIPSGHRAEVRLVDVPADVDRAELWFSDGERRWVDLQRAPGAHPELAISMDRALQLERVRVPGPDGLVCVDRAVVARPHCVIGAISFDTADWWMKPDQLQALEALDQCLRWSKPPVGALVGHADWRGSNLYNLDLSRLRAEQVRTWLRRRDNTLELDVVALGEQMSLTRPDGRERSLDVQLADDRRVEVALFDAIPAACEAPSLRFPPGRPTLETPEVEPLLEVIRCHVAAGASSILVTVAMDHVEAGGTTRPAPSASLVEGSRELARSAYGSAYLNATVVAANESWRSEYIDPSDPPGIVPGPATIPPRPDDRHDPQRTTALEIARSRLQQLMTLVDDIDLPVSGAVRLAMDATDSGTVIILPTYPPPEPVPIALDPCPERLPEERVVAVVNGGLQLGAGDGAGTWRPRAWGEVRWRVVGPLAIGASLWSPFDEPAPMGVVHLALLDGEAGSPSAMWAGVGYAADPLPNERGGSGPIASAGLSFPLIGDGRSALSLDGRGAVGLGDAPPLFGGVGLSFSRAVMARSHRNSP